MAYNDNTIENLSERLVVRVTAYGDHVDNADDVTPAAEAALDALSTG